MTTQIVLLSAVALFATEAQAGFDFGGECDAGSGMFLQDVLASNTIEVGVIPAGKRNIRIELESARDVDIQLTDPANGHQIVAWPSGDLNDAGQGCTNYGSVRVCYSGYNGVGGELGNEFIEITGDTDRDLVMSAYGYQAGQAFVYYTYDAVPTCYETGEGSFSQTIIEAATVDVGVIPAGIVNVDVQLRTASSFEDVDIQLWDGATKIVHWPDGMLNGAGADSVEYNGATIEYSGYNGINGHYGHERIRVTGKVPSALTMKAFGYTSGDAEVTYDYGEGAGDTCMGIASLQCDDGYTCKGVQTGVSDPAGSCHTERWCDNDSVATDCANVIHPMVLGAWGCEEHSCTWQMACNADADCGSGAFCGWTASNDRVCKPKGEAGDSCEGFVTPEARNFCADDLSCVHKPSDATFDLPGVCMDLTCSLADQACPLNYECQVGCPSGGNCGINPPGVCVET